jgi:glutathione S-transferase
MLKIWGRLNSVNVQKVVWCADELGLDYERIDAGGAFGLVDTEQYRAMNPNGLIPVIEDEGLVLWESNAIVRYLCARYGTRSGTDTGTDALWPQDPQIRASADRWMDWQTTSLQPQIGPAFKQLFRTPLEQQDMAIVRQGKLDIEKKLDILDAHLVNNAFAAGDHFTMGDIPLGCSVDRWFKMPLAHKAHPHIARWYSQLRQRPGAQQVVVLAAS